MPTRRTRTARWSSGPRRTRYLPRAGAWCSTCAATGPMRSRRRGRSTSPWRAMAGGRSRAVGSWSASARSRLRPRRTTGWSCGRELLREVDRSALADHRDLDLPRVFELLLDVPRYPVRQQRRRVVVDLLGVHDHADLAAGLHGVDLLDAGVAGGDLLEVAEALGVLLERLPARARASARQRVDDLDDDGLDGPQLDLVVVRLHRVGHGL